MRKDVERYLHGLFSYGGRPDLVHLRSAETWLGLVAKDLDKVWQGSWPEGVDVTRAATRPHTDVKTSDVH